MSDKLSMPMWNEQQGHQVVQTIWKQAKAHLSAGRRMVLTLAPEKRSSAENRLLHALIGEIAAQKEWAGAKRDAEIWKRLLVAAWCRTRGESVEILPAIDGHGVDIVPARTSKLTKGECADLIEFIYAWATMQDVKFTAIDQETGDIYNN